MMKKFSRRAILAGTATVVASKALADGIDNNGFAADQFGSTGLGGANKHTSPFVDNNGLTLFIDDNGVTSFIDDNGIATA